MKISDTRIEDVHAAITRVVRYVDSIYERENGEIKRDRDGQPIVKHEQRMGAVWFLLENGQTAVSFVRRSGGLWSFIKDIEKERFGGRVDAEELELGESVVIRSANIKAVKPAEEWKGQQLPQRLAITHVKLS